MNRGFGYLRFDGPLRETPPGPLPGPGEFFYGWYQAGDLVPIALSTTADGLAVAPDLAPTAVISKPTAVALPAQLMGLAGGPTSWLINFFLDNTAILGTYQIAFTYYVAGVEYTATGSFIVVAGGDIGGDVISLYAFSRPDATYVLAQLTSGVIVCGRNPIL